MTCPGDTPLHTLIRSFEGVEYFVENLLENGASDINVRNSEGETPLLLAIQNDKCSPGLINLLLRHGADVRAASSRDGNTALHRVATVLSRMENIGTWWTIAVTLHRRGSDANARNLQGCTPLHLAVESKHIFRPIVNLLLEHKSDVNARNSKGDTPLHLYMRSDTVRSFNKRRFLDKARASDFLVNDVNANGETPLQLAARSKLCDVALIKKFLELGADVSLTDATGENAYQAYCRAIADNEDKEDRRKKDILLSQKLLQGNLQQLVNSSLHVACLFHNVDAVHRLLRLGADVNSVDPFDYAPLYYAGVARFEGDLENECATIRLMLDYGADINQPHTPARPDNNVSHSMTTFLEEVIVWGSLIWRRRPGNHASNLYLDARNTFVQHAAKLLALQESQAERGVDVQLLNKFNHRLLKTYDLGKTGYNDWLSRCFDELRTMSQTKIGESRVFFYDVLVASANEALIYSKNKNLIEAFQAEKTAFPLYQGMMEAKIERGIERRKLIERATVLLMSDILVQFDLLSDDCYENILSYCSNEDLIRLIG
ncbi:serine/threonine-protein phosphatase 6 regulatory ankyrin repeat subunit A-like [Nasonia vitripennis]|uniref:Uncharacterized protein n=1 Tax=Nasonia vitripennis TaxID=7425 RepID=A0A7M7QEW3_NASVI|nr:serine/threonine-protein phosphatase 6 regulatory ankyrin repeat subunit A-like [Nasonia vitripennis]